MDIRRWFLGGTAAILALPFAAHAEQIPDTEFGYGNWAGAAYTYDETGEFSHCVVSAPFLSGDTLFLSVTRGATVIVGVSNPSFRFSERETFPVTVSVDRGAQFYARATATSSDTIFLEINDFERAMDAIQRGLVLKVQSERMTGTYSLKGTMRALASARKCAYQNYQYVSSAPQQPSEYAHEVDKTPLFQVATQMITAVEAVDFRYLSDDEIKEMGFQDGVFWFSENLDILGGTMNLNAPDGNLRETDPSDISFMNSLCSGDFASKTRAVDTAEVDQRELHGYCIEGDRRLEMIALKTRFGTRVLYNILLFGPNSTQETTEREEVTGNIALHAARFVNSE